MQSQEVSTSEGCNSAPASGHSNKSVSQETEIKISGDILDADFKRLLVWHYICVMNNDISDANEMFGKTPELPTTPLDFKSFEFAEEDGGTHVILASVEIGENEYYAVARGLHEDSKMRFFKLKAISDDGNSFNIVEYINAEDIAQIVHVFMDQSKVGPQEGAWLSNWRRRKAHRLKCIPMFILYSCWGP